LAEMFAEQANVPPCDVTYKAHEPACTCAVLVMAGNVCQEKFSAECDRAGNVF